GGGSRANRTRDAESRGARRGVPRAHWGTRRDGAGLGARRREGRAGRGAPGGARRRPRATARHPRRGEGHFRRRRAADDRGRPAVRPPPTRRGRGVRCAAPRRRRDRPRQDSHDAVRLPRPGGPPRLALAPELLRRASREVAAHVQATADAFARAGAKITEVKLPGSFDGIHAVGQTVLESEAAASHEPRFAKHADQYGPEIRRLVETGLTISAVTYLGANRARLAFREEVLELLAAHDALLSPTAPAPAPEGLASTGDASLCAPWSFAGVPAISLPSGLAPSGLPLAIQLVQAAGASARLLSVAAWCERQLAFTRSPGL